ncbi:DEAD/DEAH box helicase [Flectobacillus sp. DC10W]|uniref:DEAD/DEAH box helicase n=1 Tax=Flectobacillus longus TaxID=2984207 RepID=A0ABT6YPE4_9BACT|nr:DEAD/DEAH box helicase [Flectobacillus longus]MDI9865462.1 DEAD/DEAH box helicase [Flectobacillus longus]
MTFEEFDLNRQLLNAIADAGYETPSPIQEQAIPLVMSGHDVLGIAQTGTGKTAAYLLPILMKIKYAQGMHPRVLILAPTRELVMQIDVTITQLATYTDIRHGAIYGGLGPKTQIETIKAGIDILVATPGRFMDIYLKGELVVKELKTLVLDEADKMMDMGFMPQIRGILEVIPSKKRQNLLFSATFPPRVENLSHEFLEFPKKVEVSPQATTAEMVNQILYELPNFKTKINLLGSLMTDSERFNRVIVFCRSKEVADNIFKFLARKVVPEERIRVIHANKGQNTRINSMDDFREGNIQVLVATDVAARGIDIQMVSHVINFDVPIIYEDYVHRIGRTGRANQTGEAITFMTIAEEYHVKKIEKIIKMQIPRYELPEGLTIEQTPFIENQEMLREIDAQRKKEDPTFKGAFHEKKDIKVKSKEKQERQKKNIVAGGKGPKNGSFGAKAGGSSSRRNTKRR